MNKNNVLFSILFIASFGLIFAPPAHSAELVNLAVISDTQANRLCVATEDDGFDVRCYQPSPEILTGGVISATGISISGVISASELWVNGVSITASGGSLINALDDIGDVSATSPAANSLLRYNSGDSKWEAVGLNDGISTTSVDPNWPDLIRCSGTAGVMRLRNVLNGSDGKVYYRYGSSSSFDAVFNPDGSQYSITGAYMTSCAGKSIATLYAEGKAFNFLGNNGAQISLTHIADVSATAPTDGEALVWNDAQNRWIPGTVAAGASTLASLTDVSATVPSAGNVLSWNATSTRWEPSATNSVISGLNDIGDVNAASPADESPLVWDSGSSKWVPGPQLQGCSPGTTDILPTFTGYTTNGYTASASTESTNYWAWEAFEDNNSAYGNSWLPIGTTGWLQVQLPTARVVTGYKVTGRNWTNNSTVGPKDWTFEGSKNGSSWTILDTQTNQSNWLNSSETFANTYAFSNSAAYAYYRINITANNGNPSNMGIGELELFVNSCSGADDMGDHSASTTLLMNSNDITGAGHFLGETISTTSNVDVSGTIKISGTGDETCTTNSRGTMRLNPVTGLLQICR